MSVTTAQELLEHYGHKIVVMYYGHKDDPVSVTIECETCSTVLHDTLLDMLTDGLVTFADFEYKPEGSDNYVLWEWIGEGISGDYNPYDVYDEPRLRFTVYGKDGEQLEDASYCTTLNPLVSKLLLEVFADRILEACDTEASYKKKLEQLTWVTLSDLQSRHYVLEKRR